MKRIVSGIISTLLFVGLVVLAFNIQPAGAIETIYIRADGSVDPSSAPIQRNGDVYTLTGSITSEANGIVIERDNVILDGAGYTLRGPEGAGYIGMTNGTYIVGRTNVTISNLHITSFGKGLMLVGSSNCRIVENVVTGNGQGMLLASSSNNSIIRNRFTANHAVSIECYPGPSSDLCILENNFTDELHGIWTSSHRNTIHNNTIANCSYGIEFIYSGSNHVADNVFSNAGLYVYSSFENVVESNVVNGKPMVYLENASDLTVNDAGQVILVSCDSIRVENLSLSNTSYPLQLWGTNNSRIANNNITANNWNGIQLYYSSNNTLEGNNVSERHYRGVHFYSSPCNTLRNNNFSSDNYFNFFVDGSSLSHFIQNVDTSNTVNGKPTYYWINKTDTSVPLDAGYVALVNCTRMTVQNLTLTKNAQAILLAFTTNSTVTQNNLTKNEYDVYLYESQNNNITGNDMALDWYGVHLRNSSYNTVQGNKIKWTNYYGIVAFYSLHNCIFENTIEAWYGVWFESSSDNRIYHNSFVGTTTHQFFTRDSVNIWDNGYPSGGNYWSDYGGVDEKSGLYQNETGSDGIGDTPYILDASNKDDYSLVRPWARVVHIRADGSIDPYTASISTSDNVTYVLTGSIAGGDDGIVIERENVILDGAGYSLEGSGSGWGINVTERTNITIRNVRIRAFEYGIRLFTSLYGPDGGFVTLSENALTNNTCGIYLICSSVNIVSRNEITNNGYGIFLYSASENTLSENNVTDNSWGISLHDSCRWNTLSKNNITNNGIGIGILYSSWNNTISKNNFINNTNHALCDDQPNFWNDNYPTGGNYWSDYSNVDLCRGPFQNETGSDGIGDYDYVINQENADEYPLVALYPSIHAISVDDVKPCKTIVGQGFNMKVGVTMNNEGHFSETANVTIYANTSIITTLSFALTSDPTITIIWNTTGWAKGTYTISAVADAVQNETYTADNSLSDGLIIVTMVGDINADGKVDIKDVYAVGKAFGTSLEGPNPLGRTYNPNCDIDNDDKVDIKDYFIVCKHYGEEDP